MAIVSACCNISSFGTEAVSVRGVECNAKCDALTPLMLLAGFPGTPGSRGRAGTSVDGAKGDRGRPGQPGTDGFPGSKGARGMRKRFVSV